MSEKGIEDEIIDESEIEVRHLSTIRTDEKFSILLRHEICLKLMANTLKERLGDDYSVSEMIDKTLETFIIDMMGDDVYEVGVGRYM